MSEVNAIVGKKLDLNKMIILLIWFLDILAIWIFIPTLPDLANYYSVSAQMISYAIVAYAFFSFLSGPVLWQLSDRFGRKNILILCIIWTLLSNLIMSLTTVFLIFIIARIINWITWGNISILSAMMADISKDKKERMSNMWLIWALFWLWFIVWPAIWAIFLPLWVKAPFWLMTIASIFELLIIIFFLKETHINRIKNKINYNPFTSILKYLKDTNIRIFIVSLFILMLSFSLYQWMFPVFLNKEFAVPAYITWYIMSGIWFVVAFNQAFLLKKFWFKYFSLKKLFFIVNIWIFILFTLLFFITNLNLFLFVFFLLVLVRWLVNPIYNSEIVENTGEHERGEIMWVIASISSMTMFIGPLIWWMCIDNDISMFWFWAIIVLFSILLLFKLVGKLK